MVGITRSKVIYLLEFFNIEHPPAMVGSKVSTNLEFHEKATMVSW